MRYNAGLKMGLVGGVIIISLYLFNMLIFAPAVEGGYGYAWTTDLFVWIIQCILFYVLARSAAESQYQFQATQIDDSDFYKGVNSAAIGAALLTWGIGWAFVIVRAFIQDLNGYVVAIDPAATFCSITITAFIALGLGILAGSNVIKKYKIINNE